MKHNNLPINLVSILILFAIFILMPAILPAQDAPVIRNPAKPAQSDAGRVLALKETMRITDEEGDFFFKSPFRLEIAPDGSIFVVDRGQFLHFDSSGNFKGNYHKKGEGPGEFVNLRDIFFTKNSVILCARQPAKIIELDMSGVLLKELKKKRRMSSHRPLIYDNGNFWSLLGEIWNFGKAKTGLFESRLTLCRENSKDEITKSDLVFTGKSYMIKKTMKGGGIMISMQSIIPVMTAQDPENEIIYVTNSQSYNIQKVSLEKQKIVSVFNRQYKSISYVQPEEEEGTRTLDRPSPDYFNDTIRMYFHDNLLWVLTSTIDKEKGVLVDIFSPAGKYIDQFYLPLPQVKSPHDLERFSMAFYKNNLLVIEKDEDDTPYIIKYQYQM